MLGDGHRSYDNDKDGSTTELAGCEVSQYIWLCVSDGHLQFLWIGQFPIQDFPHTCQVDLLQEQLFAAGCYLARRR